LIVHISSINQLNKWAIDIPEYAIKLAEVFWPGPMTLILKRSEIAKNFITGGQENVGIRVPSHHMALELLSEFEKFGGVGIAAPSANKFGSVSPTSAESVNHALGDFLSSDDFLLDGGSSSVGVESTIIDFTRTLPEILRPGAITESMIKLYAGKIADPIISQDQLKFSGSFKSHYAPRARVVLDGVPSKGDGFIALFEIETPRGAVRLASPKNTQEYARCLYEALREGDNKNLARIFAISPEGNEIEVAIRDRLIKASVEKN